ncbi:MAG: large subunit ribosomal protein [Thermoleophilaceae bacterium]|nr:large subunit ribosomal protein [Thermoleophilaceae bacterium]
MSDEERKERIDEPAADGVEEAAEESKAAAAEEKAKPKPKPKPRRRRKAEPKADAGESSEADAEDAKQDAAEEDAEAEAAEADGEPPAEDEKARPKRRRRGAAEVTAGRKKPARRRSPEEIVTVRAKAKYVRTAPRKARLVIDHIRGKPVEQARALLLTTPRAASRDVLKLLDSAIANAENNHELVADELVVGKAYVDEGPTLKRFRPRAQGRATRIRKRTSHMTIELTNTNTNGDG